MESATLSDALVVALAATWGPENAFLVTTPNVPFIPEIVQGIVSVYLRDDGTFGKHDPTQWPQVFTARFPYLTAIPKPSTTHTHPHTAIWSIPSPEQFVCLPNTPVRGFGRFCPEYLCSLEPLVREISSRARDYAPRQSTADLAHLRSYEVAMTRAWERLQAICATYRDQLLQVATVRRYWLLCSAFMTYYDLVSRSVASQPLSLPANRQLMGAWTTQPEVVQLLFTLGIPVWFVRASHLISSDIRVGAFVAPSPPKTLCRTKFYGSDPLYQGLSGEHHLEVMFKAQTYRDVSLIPTVNNMDPDDYYTLPHADNQQARGYHDRASAPSFASGRQHHRSSNSKRGHFHGKTNRPRDKSSRSRYTPCRYLA